LRPTSESRNLNGLTITLVEDSACASEAIRLLAQVQGGRVRRADTLGAARRHIALYRPNAVVVDIGLPDGSGMDLIRELAAMPEPRPAIVAISGGDPADWTEAALAAGAGAVLAKPLGGAEELAAAIRAAMPSDLPVETAPDLKIARTG
jgi:DNA-binding response OmpR family regulator